MVDKLLLPFPLLSDVEGDVIKTYGVWNENDGGVARPSIFAIKKDGSVNGDLTTARIMIEDGAYFKGSIEIDKSAEKESSSHAFARSSSVPAAATATKTI